MIALALPLQRRLGKKTVEPFMSANNAVIVLRSPSATGEAVTFPQIAMSALSNEDVGDWAVALLGARAAPQSPQNRLPGGFSASHLGQRIVNGAPQSPQSFLLDGLSLPHFEQRINSPVV
jgi:hypothetical protein